MAFGDDPGGRRTIGLREIAIDQWEREKAKQEAEKQRITKKATRSVPVYLVGGPADTLAKHGKRLPDGRLEILMMPEAHRVILKRQKAGEDIGQTMVRMTRNGELHWTPIRS